ncbi:hypothetical protein B0H17DRAFT_1144086 [Mycena rosella]|uniref:Uncharacterized protein n=1 Tax=Mycena rosella TaxID=1033263 RepID=A0AAD7CU57_MYCRO|nr:hypothetical protein B0H17DRAFT_1144086 [Mycena rosella]
MRDFLFMLGYYPKPPNFSGAKDEFCWMGYGLHNLVSEPINLYPRRFMRGLELRIAKMAQYPVTDNKPRSRSNKNDESDQRRLPRSRFGQSCRLELVVALPLISLQDSERFKKLSAGFPTFIEAMKLFRKRGKKITVEAGDLDDSIEDEEE